MAWMNMWDSPVPTRSEASGRMSDAAQRGFLSAMAGCASDLCVKSNLCAKKCQPLSPVRLQGLQLLTENVQAAELLVTWHTVDSHAEHYGVRLGDGLRLYVDNQAGRLVLWRYYPEEGLDGYRSVELPDTEYLTLRIFLDRSSVEVFVNDGEATLSSRIYPQADSRQLSLYAAHGDAILTDGTLWMLT